MRSISIKRMNLMGITARMFGLPARRKLTVAQTKETMSHSDITKLEASITSPIQDTDPGSPTFGKFFYLSGYDAIGDPNHPLAP